jgi:hypothetical protein
VRPFRTLGAGPDGFPVMLAAIQIEQSGSVRLCWSLPASDANSGPRVVRPLKGGHRKIPSAERNGKRALGTRAVLKIRRTTNRARRGLSPNIVSRGDEESLREPRTVMRDR